MAISIQFTRPLSQLVGEECITQSIDKHTTLQQAIDTLIKNSAEPVKQFLQETNQRLRPSIVLMVNQRQVSQPTQHPLNDGDTVTIISPMAGG